MKSRINILIFSTLSVFMISCETIIDDIPLSRFPDLEEKLVMTSFLNPQDNVIYVSLGKSIPLFGTGKFDTTKVLVSKTDTATLVRVNNYVADAQMTISDGLKTASLKFNTFLKFYEVSRVDFRIEAGKTYTIKAQSGKLSVEASTKIPEQRINIKNLVIKPFAQITSSFFEKDTSMGYQLQFNWQDIGNEENYYKIFGELTYRQFEPSIKYTDGNEEITYLEKTKYSYLQWPNRQNSSFKSYFTDKNADGNIFKIDAVNLMEDRSKLKLKSVTYNSVNIPDYDKTVRVQLLHISKELYEYQKSISDYNRTDDNPFAEPIQVFTNVKGGFGCVAGFNRTEVRITTK